MEQRLDARYLSPGPIERASGQSDLAALGIGMGDSSQCLGIIFLMALYAA